MKKVNFEYRKSKLNLMFLVLDAYFSKSGINLEDSVKKTVYLLNCIGLSTTLSCEGHMKKEGLNTFRLFWPYIQVNLSNKVVFHLEEKEPRIERVSRDPYDGLRSIENILVLFNHSRHPYYEPNLEMSLIMSGAVDESANPLKVIEAKERRFNHLALICDKGVAGIMNMPQEMLNNHLRQRFLKRTQHQMDLFEKFLEWYLTKHEEE
jgi:hypothetical protein